ncbi:hypothetical protein AB0I60_23290 [Actinosynnema sp. NPDC050436]|uniref:hypothetical protein n=1 Tax=Actinosynnema sp. NPDC050436 TaxID=3155659 RepID=UPI00340A41BC
MKLRTTGLAAAVTLAAGLLTTSPATAAPVGVGLPAVVAAAKDKAAQKYPDARFRGAEAALDEPPVTGVEGIRRWALHFTDPSHPSGGFSYVYGVDGEYQVTEIWEPVAGLRVVDPFTMIEDKALAALRGSGVDEPFSALSLSQPEGGDARAATEPTYYFCVDHGGEGRVTGIGTETLEVYPDLYACEV